MHHETFLFWLELGRIGENGVVLLPNRTPRLWEQAAAAFRASGWRDSGLSRAFQEKSLHAGVQGSVTLELRNPAGARGAAVWAGLCSAQGLAGDLRWNCFVTSTPFPREGKAPVKPPGGFQPRVCFRSQLLIWGLSVLGCEDVVENHCSLFPQRTSRFWSRAFTLFI